MNPLPRSNIPKTILNFLWKGRFIYLQLLILAGVVWLMWPWRETSALPNPAYPAYTPEPPDRQETLILCPEVLSPGAMASARVIVYDPDSGAPVSGAQVRVSMTLPGQTVTGPTAPCITDDQGIVPIQLDVPADASGHYTLEFDVTSWIGEQHAACPVRVEQALTLDLITDRATYAPGQTIHALLRAAVAASGRAMPDLPVRFDVYDARDNRICSTQAATSDDGLALASCALEPAVNKGDYRVVAALDDPVMRVERVVSVQATMPDASARTLDDRTAQQSVTVGLARQAILLSAMPESDTLEPGIENIVYLEARYPDGTPAQCTLDLTTPDGPISLKTDAQGRAEWRITPLERRDTPQPGRFVEIEIVAQDEQGHSGQATLRLPVEAGGRGFLLRPDRLTYHPGETIHADLVASFPVGNVYLDLIWNGQLVATFSAPTTVRFSVRIDPAWTGDLVLRGYTLDNGLVADARAVSVLPPGALDVSAQAGRAVYRPGETAAVSVHVRDAQGHDTAAVLALAARDAALSAPLQAVDDQTAVIRSLRGVAATPRYAGIIEKPRAMPIAIRQQFEAVDAARAARRAAFQDLATRWMWGLVALAGMSWIVVLVGGWRGRWLNGRLIATTLIGGPFALALIAGASALLAYGGQWLFGPGALIVLGLGWLSALLALLVEIGRAHV